VQDLFFLQRHQMLVHHEKELDHLKRMMERKEEELIKNQVDYMSTINDSSSEVAPDSGPDKRWGDCYKISCDNYIDTKC
jgi:hypothetical protein